jgi:hypothetical protein
MNKDDLIFFRLFISIFIGVGSIFAIAGLIIRHFQQSIIRYPEPLVGA